jgi:dTDP-4-amino-4,6-dideoxygalactose transaminase
LIKKFKINWTNNSIRYSNSETKAVIKALKAEPFTQGKYLERFEKKFCKYLGVQNAYAVNNCSNALDLAAMLIETKKNDEIIVPAHTWCATAISFARFGAKIIWADIDSKSLIVSIDSIKKNYSKKTKAIIVVHLYGLPANMNEIVRFAKEKNIVVIEDCAQALGASINKKKVGTFGDISVFSFHSNKIITTLGEGGMIVVNNKN